MPLSRSFVLQKLMIFGLGINFSFAGIVGCGGPTEARLYPVSGKVLVNGKPSAAVQITFVPIGPPTGLTNPTAATEADGSFKLTTRVRDDGAPAGEYKVLLTKFVQNGPVETAPVTNTLADVYATAETTTVSATIEPKGNELAPFDLKQK